MGRKYYYNESKAAHLDFRLHRLRKYEGFHMFNGVWNLLCSGIFLIVIGAGYFTKIEAMEQSAPELVEVGNGLIFKGILFLIVFFIVGIMNIKATGFINKRKRYGFLKILAVVNCFTGIISIILGVFFYLELQKPETIAEFEKGGNPEKVPDFNRETFG